MRILQVISSLASGGAEIYVRNMAREFVARGHEVAIAYVSEASRTGRSLEFEELFYQSLISSNIFVYLIGHESRKHPINGGFKLRKIVDDFSPDIIHCHLYYGIFFKAFSFINVPFVYTHHSIDLGKGRLLYGFFNIFVDRYIGISKQCAMKLSTIAKRDVSLIYNGVPSFIDSEERNEKKKDITDKGDVPFTIVSVGRMDQNKNHKMLVDAAYWLRHNSNLDFKVLFLGEGPLYVDLVARSESFKLQDVCFFLGNQSDVLSYLSSSDVFVLTSHHEGLPLTLLEAMSVGCPAVTTDAGGCREIIEQTQCGLIVNDFSAKTLGRKLRDLARDPVRLAEYRDNALKFRRDYSIDASVSQHLSLYQNVLSKKN